MNSNKIRKEEDLIDLSRNPLINILNSLKVSIKTQTDPKLIPNLDQSHESMVSLKKAIASLKEMTKDKNLRINKDSEKGFHSIVSLEGNEISFNELTKMGSIYIAKANVEDAHMKLINLLANKKERNTNPNLIQESIVGMVGEQMSKEFVGLQSETVLNLIDENINELTEADFLNNWKWIMKMIPTVGACRAKYPGYPAGGDQGIFNITEDQGQEVSIALLGDWASNTDKARNIAALVGNDMDYSIHLGDTYYTGSKPEIQQNFEHKKGGTWPFGKKGSFALLGNHEMYSSGKAYFEDLLKMMGSKAPGNPKQKASYFCLENNFWRIIALDTGYDSLDKIIAEAPDTDLVLLEKQINWLKEVIFKDENDKRGIIILSHHQNLSAFNEEYKNPGKTLAALIPEGRKFIWFWGHEHRLSIYGKNILEQETPDNLPVKNNISFYGRCIGHAGQPPKINELPVNTGRNLVLYDNRYSHTVHTTDDIDVGYYGYVVLKLNNDILTIEYFDDDKNNMTDGKSLILKETWLVDSKGDLNSLGIDDLTMDRTDEAQKLTYYDHAFIN
ncbi:MAG TPA: metallophosphoesterase [Saprospiraceae bacterium]|nr:metallophosphoesterase [Saprospiraceae bacterium]